MISERWQGEVAETVFETINQEADRIEQKRKAKQKQRFDTDEKGNDTINFSVISNQEFWTDSKILSFSLAL